MKRNVITFGADGSAQALLKDSFFDTRFLGHRHVGRVSEVLFDEEKQMFYIRWLLGPCAGQNESLHERVPVHTMGKAEPDYTLVPYTRYFDTYEEAVAHEIYRVNEWRLAGHKFA